MISGSDAFAVFTHIEYAVRDWPTQTEGPFDPRTFEDEFRQAMRAVAGSGRALELNVGGPIRPWIAQWWSEEGGRAITLASDSHTPEGLAGNFFEAMAMGRVLRLPAGAPPRGRVDSRIMFVLTIIISVCRR